MVKPTLVRLLLRLVAVTALAAGLTLAGQAGPANAGVVHGRVVSANPAGFTPNINNGAVYAFLQIGSTMYAGGDFTSVTPAAGGTTLTRRGVVAFNATTGVISTFAPVFNGAVWTLATDGTSLFAGGSFTTAGGVARPYLAKLNPATGAVVTTFNAGLNRQVTDSKVVAGRLIIGGEFTGSLRAVSPSTGANTGYINFSFSSTLDANAGPLGIYRFAIDNANTRLVAVGNFTSVGGAAHPRAVMVNLGTTATLNPWYYAGLARMCEIATLPNYLRGVDFSPDGSYFVIVSTGRNPIAGDQGVTLCDAAARFETAVTTPSRPTWINYTGGDTFHSVNVTDAAVYVQGHFRWLNNEGGSDSQGPNGVPRSGIGALSTVTGRALSWNPGKARGVGGKVFLSTAAGLWVGSDTSTIGGETHGRQAFMPR